MKNSLQKSSHLFEKDVTNCLNYTFKQTNKYLYKMLNNLKKTVDIQLI